MCVYIHMYIYIYAGTCYDVHTTYTSPTHSDRWCTKYFVVVHIYLYKHEITHIYMHALDTSNTMSPPRPSTQPPNTSICRSYVSFGFFSSHGSGIAFRGRKGVAGTVDNTLSAPTVPLTALLFALFFRVVLIIELLGIRYILCTAPTQYCIHNQLKPLPHATGAGKACSSDHCDCICTLTACGS